MKVFAINGSPRKNKNTMTLLRKALDGAKNEVESKGMSFESEIINLYDLDYTGCRSCYACKLIGGKSYGHCAINDDLKPLFERIANADAIIFGSPIYFGNISAAMKGFLERLIFQYFVYDKEMSSIAPKRLRTAFIYSMNVTEKEMEELGYRRILAMTEMFVGKVFSKPEVLYVNDTFQFNDYSRYKNEVFDAEHKREVHEHQFPLDCQKAYELGQNLLG